LIISFNITFIAIDQDKQMKTSFSEQTSRLGRFVDHVNTKTGGPFSPVRRSHRINPGHEAVADTDADLSSNFIQKSAMGRASSTKTVRFFSPVKVDTDKTTATVRRGTPAVVKTKAETDDIQDLCSFFHSTLKVDDSTLKVEASSVKRTSPMPKEGRFTTMIPKPAETNGDALFQVVKRSVRRSIGEQK
jgi:hypothetical protein